MFQLDTIKAKAVSTRTTGIILAAFAAALAACSSDVGGGGTTQPITTPTDNTGAATAGLAHAARPPVSRAMPQVESYGGGVMDQPHVIPIFFGAPAQEPELMAFLQSLVGSDYWQKTTAEYGVGSLLVEAPLLLDESFPPSISESELGTWLADGVTGGMKGFPVVDAKNAVYLVFMEEHTVLDTPTGKSCVQFEATHGEFEVDGKQATYVAVPRCSFLNNDLDAMTLRTSRALIEATTNPHPVSAPAYARPDARSVGWLLGLGGGVSDRCSLDAPAKLGPYSVARAWSNAVASTGKDPCLPGSTDSFFDVEPSFPDTFKYTAANGDTIDAKSVKVALGEKKTIEVESFSEAGISWSLEAKDARELQGYGPDLALSFDSSETATFRTRKLTIERLKDSDSGASPFVIFSKANGVTHSWWGVASN